MSISIENIYEEYGVYAHHFIFGSVGRMTDALLEAHRQGFPLPSKIAKSRFSKLDSAYHEFEKMRDIGMPVPVIRAHILKAGLDPAKVFESSEEGASVDTLPIFLNEIRNKSVELKANSVASSSVFLPEFTAKLSVRYERSEDVDKMSEMAIRVTKFEEELTARRSLRRGSESEELLRLRKKFENAITCENEIKPSVNDIIDYE